MPRLSGLPLIFCQDLICNCLTLSIVVPEVVPNSDGSARLLCHSGKAGRSINAFAQRLPVRHSVRRSLHFKVSDAGVVPAETRNTSAFMVRCDELAALRFHVFAIMTEDNLSLTLCRCLIAGYCRGWPAQARQPADRATSKPRPSAGCHAILPAICHLPRRSRCYR